MKETVAAAKLADPPTARVELEVLKVEPPSQDRASFVVMLESAAETLPPSTVRLPAVRLLPLPTVRLLPLQFRVALTSMTALLLSSVDPDSSSMLSAATRHPRPALIVAPCAQRQLLLLTKAAPSSSSHVEPDSKVAGSERVTVEEADTLKDSWTLRRTAKLTARPGRTRKAEAGPKVSAPPPGKEKS